jgi:aminoglycoside phosphotransferase (APT) family kinase protein
MGLIDNYPASTDPVYGERLAAIEKRCVDWRWKLKGRIHRLRQAHGDFHPWNILFDQGAEFCVLDRSRGEWGDPADDVTCLTMNYLFSLQRSGRLKVIRDIVPPTGNVIRRNRENRDSSLAFLAFRDWSWRIRTSTRSWGRRAQKALPVHGRH